MHEGKYRHNEFDNNAQALSIHWCVFRGILQFFTLLHSKISRLTMQGMHCVELPASSQPNL
eukprot:scaffold10496_cov88-Cylindrotheca_fusiformis.AAC.1